jgi:hypothetical protein
VAEQLVPMLMVQTELGENVPEPRGPGEKVIVSPTIEPELPETTAVHSVVPTTVTGLVAQDKDVEVVAGGVAGLTTREKVPKLPALLASPS